jgi:hypothetical protein
MNSQNVTFRNAVVPMENLTPDDKQVEMEIVEITYPDGKVIAFPAKDISPETGRRYRDMFGTKYKAFKNGEPDPDRVAALKREIEEKQAELDGLQASSKDDKRVQENLGYGKLRQNPPVTDHATAARDTDARRRRAVDKASDDKAAGIAKKRRSA